jgi:hypothetical protein
MCSPEWTLHRSIAQEHIPLWVAHTAVLSALGAAAIDQHYRQ